MESGQHKLNFEIATQNQNMADLINSQAIPYNHLVFNPKKNFKTVVEHCKSVYDSMFFIKNLIPTIKDKLHEKVISKRIMLNSLAADKKDFKTLFIDLDETLISNNCKESSEPLNKIYVDESEVKFRLRPYAIQFLKNMSQIFQVVLFTSAEQNYAKAFFDYLNQQTGNAICHYLCRNACIHIYKSLFFKDLRVIGNRNLKNMILLDNSVYSIGSLITNGIPIASYTGDTDDLQLMYIEPYLKRINQAEDVREFNAKQLNLFGILNVKVMKK